MTGGELIAEYLVKERVPYVVGIPGHGCLPLVDAFVDRKDRITVLQAVHEQGAVHLADGYYRASGQPLGVFTSIGPGAVNTAMGLAQCFIDSTAVLAMTGAVHTHMRGRAVLQEIERHQWMNNARILEPAVKRYWQVSHVAQLPYVMHRAFNQMLGGRRGPVLLDLPMDVQADRAMLAVPEPAAREPQGRPRPDAREVRRAAELLLGARRPVLLVGGGAITAEASAEVRRVAEFLGAPVVTTSMGKGAIPEDHDLNAWACGDLGSIPGNALTRTADVLLAVGCRFTDRCSSSYRQGITFSIPPSKLIHLDIDPAEIGKNYPVEVALVGDARAGLDDLALALADLGKPADYRQTPYFAELQRLKGEWEDLLQKVRHADVRPTTISRALLEARQFLDRDAIVVTGAGLPQSQVYQEFPVYGPRQHITSGGFSTMGFTVPGAIGAKLAAPARQVLGVAGDGDFLQSCQELGMAAQYDIPVVYLVLNNFGWQSIKNLQTNAYGPDRVLATPFLKKDGTPYSPHIADLARSFGCYAERVEDPTELPRVLRRAFGSGQPAVIELLVNRDLPWAGLTATGWWDVPVPAYLEAKRAAYDQARAEEVLR
ncbi:MAG: thiamine pyrophosphate-binding protein [Candidatus Sericytochromatia bacterium]|nr:thiamine pyrophosphate-binding protein [Candidatus Tanganyikabacteria bacterium]